MTGLLAEIFVLSLGFLTLLGWGAFLMRLLNLKSEEMPFYMAANGFVVVIFLGGILNAIGLVNSYTLNSIILTGLCLFSYLFAIPLFKKKIIILRFTELDITIDRHFILKTLYFLLIFAVTIFLCVTLLPSSTYNLGDDLRRYIPRTVRMLQTGSIGGDPFNGLGLDSLGAQEFMRVFILRFFKIAYFVGFDTIFCFILTLLLFYDFCKAVKINPSFSIIAFLPFILINPQQVNLSAIYSGSLVIVSLVISLTVLYNAIEKNEAGKIIATTVPVSFFCASLLCLKNTFLPYVLLHVFFYFVFIGSLLPARKYKTVIAIACTLLFTFCFLLPWLVIHFQNFTDAFMNSETAASPMAVTGILYGESLRSSIQNIVLLFSLNSLFWGGKPLYYTLCVILMIVFILLDFFKNYADGSKAQIPSLNSAVYSCIIIFLFFPLIFDVSTAIRYTLPFICAIFPILSIIIYKRYIFYPFMQKGRAIQIFSGALPLFLFVILYTTIANGFAQNVISRADKMLTLGTNLSFPYKDVLNHKIICQHFFRQSEATKLASIQSLTEPGSGILSSTPIPFRLDYARNQIYSVDDILGLCAPWIKLSVDASPEEFRQYLLSKKINYVIWDYNGFSMKNRLEAFNQFKHAGEAGLRKTGEYGLFLDSHLRSIAISSDVVFNDGKYMLFSISAKQKRVSG